MRDGAPNEYLIVGCREMEGQVSECVVHIMIQGSTYHSSSYDVARQG